MADQQIVVGPLPATETVPYYLAKPERRLGLYAVIGLGLLAYMLFLRGKR